MVYTPRDGGGDFGGLGDLVRRAAGNAPEAAPPVAAPTPTADKNFGLTDNDNPPPTHRRGPHHNDKLGDGFKPGGRGFDPENTTDFVFE